MRLLLLLSISLLSFQIAAQDTILLTLNDVLFNVTRWHPIARQADLITAAADGSVMMARGSFDPVVGSYLQNKELNGKHYYTQFGTGIKVPTRTGISFKAGFDRADGNYVSGFEQTGKDGLVYAGIEVPLGRRLLIDEQRLALRQALLFEQQADFERANLLNMLYARVYRDYASWAANYQTYLVFDEAVDLAQIRLEAMRRSFIIEERSAPDTLEAFLQYQSRLVERNAALIETVKSYFMLEAHLWSEAGEPLAPSMAGFVVPQLIDEIVGIQVPALPLDELTFAENQPLIQASLLELRMLDQERRYKTEMLKPQLDFQYNLIHEPFYNGAEMLTGISPNNYKLGFNFYMPIFLRKERGSLNITKLKIEAKQLEIRDKQRLLWQKFSASMQIEVLLQGQLAEVSNMMQNYRRLWEVEYIKFNMGESTLFMINAREVKMIESNVKIIETSLKMFDNRVEMLWLNGVMR